MTEKKEVVNYSFFENQEALDNQGHRLMWLILKYCVRQREEDDKSNEISEGENKTHQNYVQITNFDKEIQSATKWLHKGEDGRQSATSGRDQ